MGRAPGLAQGGAGNLTGTRLDWKQKYALSSRIDTKGFEGCRFDLCLDTGGRGWHKVFLYFSFVIFFCIMKKVSEGEQEAQ